MIFTLQSHKFTICATGDSVSSIDIATKLDLGDISATSNLRQTSSKIQCQFCQILAHHPNLPTRLGRVSSMNMAPNPKSPTKSLNWHWLKRLFSVSYMHTETVIIYRDMKPLVTLSSSGFIPRFYQWQPLHTSGKARLIVCGRPQTIKGKYETTANNLCHIYICRWKLFGDLIWFLMQAKPLCKIIRNMCVMVDCHPGAKSNTSHCA